jgi:hypothetical protein
MGGGGVSYSKCLEVLQYQPPLAKPIVYSDTSAASCNESCFRCSHHWLSALGPVSAMYASIESAGCLTLDPSRLRSAPYLKDNV